MTRTVNHSKLGLGSILDTYKYCDTVIVRYRCFAVIRYFPVSNFGSSVLLYFCTSALLHFCTSILLYFCTSVLQYFCTSVLRYFDTSILRYFDISPNLDLSLNSDSIPATRFRNYNNQSYRSYNFRYRKRTPFQFAIALHFAIATC